MRKTQNGPRRKLTVLSLAAATYFMVSGGPYGVEELVQDTGYKLAIVILFIIPLIWSLPTGLMVGELAAALPAEGGFYVWVRRAMGPFWGFQEAWLSLVASIFDMAIYPTLFVLYLGRLWPAGVAGHRGVAIAAAMIAVCLAVEPAGRKSRGHRINSAGRADADAVRDHYCLCFFSPPHAWANAARAGQSSYRNVGGHVELHGLGQRVHRGQ